MTVDNVPSEDTEQAELVGWLEQNGLVFTAVPNHTWTPSMNQKMHNKRIGVRAGFPDIIVIIPPERSVDGEGYFCALEMKRLKGSSTSDSQKEWLSNIKALGVKNIVSDVCKGAEAAKAIIRDLCKDTVDDVF
jgi:hypothetical protein